VEALFREEMQMLKETSFIEEWLEEALAQGVARGEAQGLEQGLAQGETQAARSFLLRQLRKRFGPLPAGVVERIEAADREWCEAMGERLLDAASLEEMGLGGIGAPPS
jgi:flagellar biosynthesis/type III secretory pathway protein FliH